MTQTIAAGTLENNVTVSFQNILDVYGTGDGVTIEPLAEVFIYSRGTIINGYQEGNNSVEYVYARGLNKNGTLAGGEELVDGGVDSGSNLLGNGVQEVENGGIAYNLNATASVPDISGGQIIGSGGTAYYTTIGNFYEQEVDSGGIAIGSTVNKGGYIQVEAGGTMSDALINVGGGMAVRGSAERITIDGGEIVVYTVASNTHALITHAIVNNGGTQYVDLGGTANSTAINYEGKQTITSGGLADGLTTINNGGTEVILSGGLADGMTIIDGGTEIVEGTSAGKIDFSGTGGILQIGTAASIHTGTKITGLVPGDTIELMGASSVKFKSVTIGGSLAEDIIYGVGHTLAVVHFKAGEVLKSTTIAGGEEITVQNAKMAILQPPVITPAASAHNWDAMSLETSPHVAGPVSTYTAAISSTGWLTHELHTPWNPLPLVTLQP